MLVVEDHRPTAELLKYALSEIDPTIDVEVVHDGGRCLSLLRRPRFAPDIVFLDLDLPRVDGFEVIEAVKSDRRLRHIPIVVVSAEEAPETIARCYHLGANGFISKPSDFESLVTLFESVLSYWFSTTELPDQELLTPEEA